MATFVIDEATGREILASFEEGVKRRRMEPLPPGTLPKVEAMQRAMEDAVRAAMAADDLNLALALATLNNLRAMGGAECSAGGQALWNVWFDRSGAPHVRGLIDAAMQGRN